MKTLFNYLRYTALHCATLLVAFSMLACQRTRHDSPTPKEKSNTQMQTAQRAPVGMSVVDGRLVLPNSDEYEALIEHLSSMSDEAWDNWERENNFVSLRTALKDSVSFLQQYSANLNSSIIDELISTMLSPKGIIQIDDYLYKLETDNDRTLAILANDANNLVYYDLFVRGIDIPNITKTFTNDEPALAIRDEEKYNKKRCKEKGEKDEKDKNDKQHFCEIVIPSVPACKKLRADTKHGYQRSPVYFSLMTEIQYRQREAKRICTNFEDFWSKGIADSLAINGNCKFVPICGSEKTYTYTNPQAPDKVLSVKKADRILFRPYASGNTPLKKYFMSSKMTYKSPCQQIETFSLADISRGY